MNLARIKQAARAWALPALGCAAIAVAASVATTIVLKPPAGNASLGASTRSAAPGLQPASLNATGDEVWGANYFPNVQLTDQDGKSWRFFDDMIKGKVVSINFIFTSCSASCGLETARLVEVQKLLGDRVGKDVFFYSISIDPLNDTPSELKKYAGKFGADMAGWRFLTGKPADIELIRRKLGMYEDKDSAQKNQDDHVLHTMLGNQATGRWMKGSPYENPQFTATQLGIALHNFKDRAPESARYENAPLRLRTMSDGEKIFRHRCAACHTIDGAKQSARHQIGPDLDGVTKRRDAQWLARWMKEPDRMLQEKDPVATALYERYNKVAMPNLKLDAKDISAVLGFIEEESSLPSTQRRVAVQ